ncbi:MAG TPA: AAA family ATPase [Gemmatimonadaceae bacterium]|nr:AAA family ATPase [Gemmatimonadaceae bacterium]
MQPQDDLTQLPTRRAFSASVDAALRAMAAHGGKASFVVFDLDGFGALTATHGRPVADALLRETADLIRVTLRSYDLAGRVGDDEFGALLLDCPLEQGLEVADRVVRAVASHGTLSPSRGALITATVSAGAAGWPEHGATAEELLTAAGRALAHVKKHGRDGVAAATSFAAPMPPLSLAADRFVGRERERARLHERLDAAIAGDPSIVFLTGEAGVGKTSLAQQLESTIRLRGGSLVAGHCAEGEVRAPFAAWAQILAGVARLGSVARKNWRELPRLVPGLGEAHGPAAHGDKYALFEETVAFLNAATAIRPIVALLDDAQWADPGTWELLEYLAPTLGSERLMLVVTLRADAPSETLERAQRLMRAARAYQLTLDRLTRDEVRRWVTAAFHGQDAESELMAFLYGHTDGNPLFVVQVMRALVDERAVWHDGTGWRWRALDDLNLPVAVNDLITRRLARLSARTRELLAACAVIGREFDVDLARAAEFDGAMLQDAIDEGLRAGVLQPAALRGGERYAFTHAMLSALLRAAIAPRRLRVMHRRVARALEQRAPERVAEIATHYDQAGAAADAYRYALLAADRAGAVYAQAEASNYLKLAERHAASDDEMAVVQSRLARAAESSGEYDNALTHAARALAHFEHAGDATHAIALRRLMARVRGLLGTPATETLAECERLIAAAREAGADEEHAQILALMSRLYDRVGDSAAAARTASHSAEIAERLGNPRLLAKALTRLGVCVELEHPDRAAEHYRTALDLYRGVGDARGQAYCHNNLGIVFARRGEMDYAERELSTAITLGRTIGAPDLSGLFTLNLGVLCLKRGAFVRARELMGESLAQFAAVKNSERQLFALLNLAHLDLERGEAASAADLYEAVEALAHRIGQHDVMIGALAGRALALTRTDHENASAARAAALERGDARPDWYQGRELVEALALRELCSSGHTDEALARYERALPGAETADLYTAAWLTAEFAPHIAAAKPVHARNSLERYARVARQHGYTRLSERCTALAATIAASAPREAEHPRTA